MILITPGIVVRGAVLESYINTSDVRQITEFNSVRGINPYNLSSYVMNVDVDQYHRTKKFE